MSVITNNLLLTGDDGGYQISRSVRLRSSASAYFNRTFSTPTTQNIWTFSTWLKRGDVAASGSRVIFSDASGSEWLTFNSSNNLQYYSAGTGSVVSSGVYRDPAAWYHIVCQSNGTSIKTYVNNTQVGTGTGAHTLINSATGHYIGRDNNPALFDGYLTEINFIDGQALTPSSFGETDTITGVWKPKAFSGTYGTNGFYLNFKDPSSTTTIGYDYSGNSNNWTSNNVSVTSGVTYDSMLDVPTLYADGGNGRGNYAVGNPLVKAATGALADGNLSATLTGGSTPNSFGSIAMTSGKWYWEITQTYSGRGYQVGIDSNPNGCSTSPVAAGGASTGYGYANVGGNKINNNSTSAYGTAWFTSGQTYTIGVAFDADNGTLAFYLNGTSQGTAYTGLTSGPYFPSMASSSGSGADTLYWNFGQRPFSYTPPTGFKALNTYNLPDSTIKKGNAYFDVVTRVGFGTSGGSVTSLNFQPDLLWEKARNNAFNHYLMDAVRGVSNVLNSNLTNAENSQPTYVTAFNSNGYTLGSNDYASSVTLVDWLWKAGGTAVSNTSGSITSSVSASPSAGFSVVTWAGNGSTGAVTLGHGLGVAPSMVILKSRTTAGQDWLTYHVSAGNTKGMYLNSTAAATTNSAYWNNTTPTSTVFTTTGNTSVSNQSGQNYITYCFAEVAGYSKFGSYTGNGSADGPFVYLGFRPRYVLAKRSDSISDWSIMDTSRNTYNVTTENLYADLTNAADSAYFAIDITSNGFKVRSTLLNVSSGIYIYAAFAENPFKNSLAR